MTVGQRIKLARKAKALSQRELAEKVDLSPMAISKYERDQDMPGSKVISRLSQALSVSIEYFFRPFPTELKLQAFRKNQSLSIKSQDAVQARIQEWLERYLELEELFPDEGPVQNLSSYSVYSYEGIEDAAQNLRDEWRLGTDPIENFTELLEDQGIKVGLIEGEQDFDACTFLADNSPVIVTKMGIPGDRQRFNLGHELGHLVLQVADDLDAEKASHRFVGAFLAPAQAVRKEIGNKRTALDMNELYLLKNEYGLSMQALIFRAKDLGIIEPQTAKNLFKQFRMRGWHKQEPGKPYPAEMPMRLERLVYRALAEDLISRSRAKELLGSSSLNSWLNEELEQDDAMGAGN